MLNRELDDILLGLALKVAYFPVASRFAGQIPLTVSSATNSPTKGIEPLSLGLEASVLPLDQVGITHQQILLLFQQLNQPIQMILSNKLKMSLLNPFKSINPLLVFLFTVIAPFTKIITVMIYHFIFSKVL